MTNPFVIVSDQIFLRFDELPTIFNKSESYFRKLASLGNSKIWQFTTDNEGKKLLKYETLKAQYKAMINSSYGCPVDYVKKIEKRQGNERVLKSRLNLATDWAQSANTTEFYEIQKEWHDQRESAIHDIEAIHFATSIIRWYNDLKPTAARELGFSSKVDLLKYVHEMKQVKENKFIYAGSFSRFRRKFGAYKKNGWQALVSKKRNNSNSSKLANETQKSLVRILYNQHTCPTFQMVADQYNKMAVESGWKTVARKTIERYLKQPGVLFESSTNRLSVREWEGRYMPAILRDRPSEAGILWIADATPAELYFQEGTKTWNRMQMCLIIDGYNDTILGWAFGDSENSQLIAQAWRMAIINTEKLPVEVKMDRFSLKRLTPLYESIATHVRPSKAGNAKDKIIEPMFKRFNYQELKRWPNWSGSNVTARSEGSQPNSDFNKMGKKFYPKREEVMYQLLESIQSWNDTRHNDWVESIARNPKVRDLEKYHLVDLFGSWLPYDNYKYGIKGIGITIGGVEHNYRIWDDELKYQQLIGMKGHKVKMLSDDLSLIKVENSKGDVFWLSNDQKEKMTYTDSKEGDRIRLNVKLRFQSSLIEHVKSLNNADRELLSQKEIEIKRRESEALTKGFFVVDGRNKKMLHDSENTLKDYTKVEHSEEDTDDYYDRINIDFLKGNLPENEGENEVEEPEIF